MIHAQGGKNLTDLLNSSPVRLKTLLLNGDQKERFRGGTIKRHVPGES
jgi:hypothetical protein